MFLNELHQYYLVQEHVEFDSVLSIANNVFTIRHIVSKETEMLGHFVLKILHTSYKMSSQYRFQ
jgi:hypothetical protein